VYLRDIWPSDAEVEAATTAHVTRDLYLSHRRSGFASSPQWDGLVFPTGQSFTWPDASEYIKRPPFFDDQTETPAPVEDILHARTLLMLGDGVTTDHISPIGAFPADSPAGRYLIERGVAPRDFSFYGARRVNHEVMTRGTFANLQLRNEMVPGIEGGYTRHMPDGRVESVFDAAMRYAAERVPVVVVAGAEYGVGSSRDWAAKGTRLLGVRAVLAEGFERIHRSNLVGMGVLPLELPRGTTRQTLGLTGEETFTVRGLSALAPRMELLCLIRRSDGTTLSVPVRARVDTSVEVDWYRHGGVLNYVLVQLLRSAHPSNSGSESRAAAAALGACASSHAPRHTGEPT
jgi:aconitate hydratase